ncbi:MAG: DUF2851 family protein [Chthoniobacterales bacterium]
MTPDHERYAELRAAARVLERPLLITPRTYNELELQARWFAGDFGRNFRAVTGEEIEVVQFGIWNREAGPDFSDAAIRIDGAKVVRGSIEFELSDTGWETHGHATNAAFDDAILHVFVNSSGREFFTRTNSNRSVLQVRVDPATVPDAFSSNVPLAKPGRCHAPLRDVSEERASSILDAAARFRLGQKAARLQRISTNHGRDEALFQELAGALGYKQNKPPFILLAQRLTLRHLREHSSDTEALLFGVAGFLRADLADYNDQTRDYVRDLWERWWLHRDALDRFVLPVDVWKLSGARPLNHPQRRIAALAAIAREWPKFVDSLGRKDTAVTGFFRSIAHPFLGRHYTLTSDGTAKPMALVGDTRIAEILANVIYPWRLSQGEDIWPRYTKLSAKLTNRRVETAASRLFGDDDRRRVFLKTLAHQQGLLQIYEDFCMQDNSDCDQCPFPEQMRKWP